MRCASRSIRDHGAPKPRPLRCSNRPRALRRGQVQGTTRSGFVGVPPGGWTGPCHKRSRPRHTFRLWQVVEGSCCRLDGSGSCSTLGTQTSLGRPRCPPRHQRLSGGQRASTAALRQAGVGGVAPRARSSTPPHQAPWLLPARPPPGSCRRHGVLSFGGGLDANSLAPRPGWRKDGGSDVGCCPLPEMDDLRVLGRQAHAL